MNSTHVNLNPPKGEGVSLALTVRNEAGSIGRLLRSISAQTLQPLEVIIVDGGSTDNTVEAISQWANSLPIRLIERPGANISEGRNTAIQAAACELVAVTDAGVRLDPGWLEALVNPLLNDSADVVSGWFVPDVDTAFERAMGATVLPALEDIDPAKFLPSSRSVAFRKSAWVAAGGYPEWLDYCEDLVFDMRLKAGGRKFSFAPEAVVHFKPRSTLRAFYTQYYRYARGDGKANLWLKRHIIRYSTYTFGPLLALWGARHAGSLVGKAALLLVLAGTAGYCRRPYLRLLPQLGPLSTRDKLIALGAVPVIRLVGDAAKMAGYPVGVAWRLRHKQNLGDGPTGPGP